MVTHSSRSWSWMIDSHPFRSSQSAPPSTPTHTHFPQIRLFQTFTLKQQGQGHGLGQRSSHITHPVSNRCTSFRFTSIGPTIPEICPIECLTLKKHIQNVQRKFGKRRVSNRFPPKSNQVISMAREIMLLSCVVMGWVVLTLFWRQANLCLSM